MSEKQIKYNDNINKYSIFVKKDENIEINIEIYPT